MPRKKAEGVARFRVTVPTTAYKRMEVLAERMAIDVPTLVRIMSSLQLVQWENMANPMGMMSTEVQKAMANKLMDASAELFPEVPGLEMGTQDSADDRVPVPVPAAVPVSDAHRFGFKPKGELEDSGVWVPTHGYMAGL